MSKTTSPSVEAVSLVQTSSGRTGQVKREGAGRVYQPSYSKNSETANRARGKLA